jgi:hypothetical protein
MATQTVLGIIMQIITLAIIIPLSALALYFSCMIFKNNISYKKALIPASIVAGVIFLFRLVGTISQNTTIYLIMLGLGFFVSLALYIVIPSLLLKMEWNPGIFVGLVWFFLMLIISFIVGLMVGLITVMIGLGIALA